MVRRLALQGGILSLAYDAAADALAITMQLPQAPTPALAWLPLAPQGTPPSWAWPKPLPPGVDVAGAHNNLVLLHRPTGAEGTSGVGLWAVDPRRQTQRWHRPQWAMVRQRGRTLWVRDHGQLGDPLLQVPVDRPEAAKPAQPPAAAPTPKPEAIQLGEPAPGDASPTPALRLHLAGYTWHLSQTPDEAGVWQLGLHGWQVGEEAPQVGYGPVPIVGYAPHALWAAGANVVVPLSGQTLLVVRPAPTNFGL